MTTTTTVNGFTKPSLTDASNIETAVGTLADGIDLRVNPIFATVAARDTALPTPTQGQEAYVTATSEKYVYTGSAWIGLVPRSFYCSSVETVTDSTTLANSTSMVCSVEANSVYRMIGRISYSNVDATSANDIKFAWTLPAAASGLWTPQVPDVTIASGIGSVGVKEYNMTGAVPAGVLTGNTLTVPWTGYLTVAATAGNMQLQFAENTAVGGVTSVSIQVGSWFEIRKIA